MTIKPIVKLYLANGKKAKAEVYNRPAVLIVKMTNSDGKLVEVGFTRCGPDEYKEYVPKVEEAPIEEKKDSLIITP